MIKAFLSLTVAGSFVRLGAAQQDGWIAGEVNTTMCYWQNPRVGVIRDTVYIDGGYLWWNPGMADGSYNGPVADGNPLGDVYLLDFGTPFNTSQNISAILTTISKASGGSGDANNVGPQYIDGTMFANDFDWFTYGGLLPETLAYRNPPKDSVASYQKYPQGPPKNFEPGYILETLPDGITRYVTYGAGVSIPSENLGFYFSGLRSASGGEIDLDPGPANESYNADVISPTLIELNMAVQGQETWKNHTLPSAVPGRASAEIAWVPVSEQGILVAIGGVIDPVYVNVNESNSDSVNAASESISPGFMSNVSVYDIAKDIWYEQPTSGQIPGQLAEGCTVVASAQDGSSHNIYWYGGFDGLHQTQNYSDDVWILSVPSFMWMRFKIGDPNHARAGHRCVKPYPDQMFVIGGQAVLSGTEPTCLDGSIIQIFNLSSGDWLDSYDPNKWSNYTVPDMIVQMIGGSGTGSATQTAPASSPTSFANPALDSLFQQKYNTSKITTWYPYQSSTTSPTSRPNLPSPSAVNKSSTPSYLAPVLGVVLGLFFLTLLVLAFLLYRRRKFLKLNAGTNPSESGTMDNRFWVANWLRSTPVDAKAPTVTTDETPMTPYECDQDMQEVGGTQLHEMMDTSKPVELHGTGFVPIDASQPIRNGLTSSPSVTSQASTVSRISRNSVTRPPISPLQTGGADSPLLGAPNDSMRVMSGVSNISETDRGHLRGISETSVSTEGNYAMPNEGTILPGVVRTTNGRLVSPLSPHEAENYLNAPQSEAQGPTPTPSQRRRSNFSESLDEVRR